MNKTKEVSEKYLKEIYLNILKAIIIVLYFFVLNLAYENISTEYIEIGIKIFTMIFLFISIYIFEKSYKKDDEKLALQGIEILALSAYTLTTKYITNKFKFDFKSYSLVASYIFAIYFVLKCIVIYTKGRKELSEEYSDIKEIVKKTEPVKKEATKKRKENAEEVESETPEAKNVKESDKTEKANSKSTKKTTEKSKTKKMEKLPEEAKKKSTKKSSKEKKEVKIND